MQIRILLVDDHEMVRRALRSVLEAEADFEVVEEATSGPEAVEAAARLGPDVVVMDLKLPGMAGIDAARDILARDPSARIVIISAYEQASLVEEALRAGALGYVAKTGPVRELVEAIEAVHEGRSYLAPAIAHHAVAAIVRSDDAPPRGCNALTRRERQVLSGIAEGLSSKEIATQLHIGHRTVESHRTSVMRKFGVHRASGLVRIAIREGILAP